MTGVHTAKRIEPRTGAGPNRSGTTDSPPLPGPLLERILRIGQVRNCVV